MPPPFGRYRGHDLIAVVAARPAPPADPANVGTNRQDWVTGQHEGPWQEEPGVAPPRAAARSDGTARTAGGSGVDVAAVAEFEQFFRRHHQELARVAYAFTGDHAEADDVVADALASAWQRWDRVRETEHTLAYVRRSVVNLAATRIRRTVSERRRFRLMQPLTSWLTPGPDVPALVDLRHALVGLPPGQRACVVLRHVAELSTGEVAEALGISEGAVKSQTSKGLRKLRNALDGPQRQGFAAWAGGAPVEGGGE